MKTSRSIKRKTILRRLTLLGISCLIGGYEILQADAANDNHSVQDAAPSLVVSIASVVEQYGGRIIGLWNEVPHFDVVIRNASAEPIKLWAENCSFGNGSLSLEIVAMDGKVLPQPILVVRHAMAWGANNIHGVTLEPGDVAVREVHLYPYQPGEREKPTFEVGTTRITRDSQACQQAQAPICFACGLSLKSDLATGPNG